LSRGQGQREYAFKRGNIVVRYAVMFEVEEGELMYASGENPFTYDSSPLIFVDKAKAEEYAKTWNTGRVVEYKTN
jgi:nuclear transport factor 2 (NTF2) superfamily protein